MLLFADNATWATDYPIWAVLAGLTMLVVGAELLVRGAVWIALSIGMSRMAVGLTLVSIGTSLPELMVTLTAADGKEDLAMGGVLGSNVANVLLIVGATALVRAIHIKTRWFELGYMLLLTALVSIPFVTAANPEVAHLSRWLAGILLTVLIVFLGQLLRRERAARKLLTDEPPHPTTPQGWLVHSLMLGAGFTMLSYGADWLVEGAAEIAADMGMSHAVVGVTVVAIGTSMPELATSVVAALRGQPEICIGNVIGSNIFNIGAVLGGAGLVRPFAFGADKLLVTLGVAGLSALLIVVVLRKLDGVPRWVGALFFLAYCGFTAYMVMAQPAVE